MPPGFYGGACVLSLRVFRDVFLKRRRARTAEVTP